MLINYLLLLINKPSTPLHFSGSAPEALGNIIQPGFTYTNELCLMQVHTYIAVYKQAYPVNTHTQNITYSYLFVL